MLLLLTRPRKLLDASKKSARASSASYFQTEHLLKDLHGRSFRGGLVTLCGQGAILLLQSGSPVKVSEIALSFWSALCLSCLAGLAAWMFRHAVISDARPIPPWHTMDPISRRAILQQLQLILSHRT